MFTYMALVILWKTFSEDFCIFICKIHIKKKIRLYCYKNKLTIVLSGVGKEGARQVHHALDFKCSVSII